MENLIAVAETTSVLGGVAALATGGGMGLAVASLGLPTVRAMGQFFLTDKKAYNLTTNMFKLLSKGSISQASRVLDNLVSRVAKKDKNLANQLRTINLEEEYEKIKRHKEMNESPL
jgi:hypothetical protein